jgi:hypothetical protein
MFTKAVVIWLMTSSLVNACVLLGSEPNKAQSTKKPDTELGSSSVPKPDAVSKSDPSQEHSVEQLKELLPGIFVGDHIVEFAGEVAVNAHHPETPDVFLEMLITAPDSREHESLVVSTIKPSALHAGLLAAGFEPGSPMRRVVAQDGTESLAPATGDPLIVMVALIKNDTDSLQYAPIESWVTHLDLEKNLVEDDLWQGLVFAGSLFNQRGYAADDAGTLVSLTSFMNEVIAPLWGITDQAAIHEPVWIANVKKIPTIGTKVRIRVQSRDDD